MGNTRTSGSPWPDDGTQRTTKRNILDNVLRDQASPNCCLNQLQKSLASGKHREFLKWEVTWSELRTDRIVKILIIYGLENQVLGLGSAKFSEPLNFFGCHLLQTPSHSTLNHRRVVLTPSGLKRSVFYRSNSQHFNYHGKMFISKSPGYLHTILGNFEP